LGADKTALRASFLIHGKLLGKDNREGVAALGTIMGSA